MRNSILTLFILSIVFPCSSLWSQYDEVGYDRIREQWNVQLTDFFYQWNTSTPESSTGFYFQIENNTIYTITAIDVELEFSDGGKTFFKKYCQINVNHCNPGDVMNTEVWNLDPPILSKYFRSKKFRYTYKVKNTYSPKS